MNILQSLHGLIPVPVPCFGDFKIWRYSERRGSLVTSRVSRFIFSSSFRSFVRLHPVHPKGSAK